MLVWETDPSMRDNELGAAFADVWCAIPKVVFSRTLDSVQGSEKQERLRCDLAAAWRALWRRIVRVAGAEYGRRAWLRPAPPSLPSTSRV
jgi:hypothetical protein